MGEEKALRALNVVNRYRVVGMTLMEAINFTGISKQCKLRWQRQGEGKWGVSTIMDADLEFWS